MLNKIKYFFDAAFDAFGPIKTTMVIACTLVGASIGYIGSANIIPNDIIEKEIN